MQAAPPEETGTDLFATETMAELCARQGRTGDAIAIYRTLLGGAVDGARRERWSARLAELRRTAAAPPPASASAPAKRASAPAAAFSPVASPAPAPAPAPSPARAAPAGPPHRLPLLIRQPVRSGQIVYAEGNDLIVLAPVNPGAQLIADGNIHVYGPLRGRAVAGAHGAADARIFCLRLEAELVGVDHAYLMADDIPSERVGGSAQVWLDGDRVRLAPL
jgi:septum site-determining protein MinC